ncbi:MAG: four helix bundle protein [Deltaproteobacteria bacterium]|nr:four helix bundle protein [Deltaproteobacteria bacterium]
MLKDFRAFQISKEFYQRCKTIKLPAFLRDQLARASSSIALNLAESSGKRTSRDRVRYYTMALGSVRECEAILEIENVQDPVAKDLLNQLGAILFKLCQIPVENTKVPQKTRDDAQEDRS